MTRAALVTGASGFIGRHVCAVLAARGYRVTALGRAGGSRVDADARIELADIGSLDEVQAALEQAAPSLIFHLAGVSSAPTPDDLYRINTIFGVTLATAAARWASRPRLLATGTAAEYGPHAAGPVPISETTPCVPTMPYGISKLSQTTHILSQFGDFCTVARLFNPVGPGIGKHLALGSFAAQINAMGPAGGVLKTGNLSSMRDFYDARAAAACLVDLAELPAATGQVVNVASGKPTVLRDIVSALMAAAGKPVELSENVAGGSATGHLDCVLGDPARLI